MIVMPIETCSSLEMCKLTFWVTPDFVEIKTLTEAQTEGPAGKGAYHEG